MCTRIVLLLLVLSGAWAARPLGQEAIRGQRMLTQAIEEAAAPEAAQGEVIEDQHIVFMQVTEDLRAATESLAQQVQEAMASSGVTVEAASASGPFSVISSINTATPVAAAAAAAGSGASKGVQAIVVKAKPDVLNLIQQQSNVVRFTIPDVKAFSAAAIPACVKSAQVGGPTAAPAVKSTFSWPGCYSSATTQLMYYSQTCGNNKIQYTTMLAVDKATGATIRNKGKPCILYADASRASWSKQRFGLCGRAPVIAPNMPVSVCSSTDPKTPPPSPPVVPPPSTSIPVGPPGILPRQKLAAGEEVPTGVARIEAVTSYGAISSSGQQLGVAVADSGIDCTHPDINCAGSMSWVKDSEQFPQDSAGDKDFYGHGTHVAGIIGARNNGQGVIGVSPGMPVYSLKVLNGKGEGSTSSWLSSINWMINEGLSKGVRVINFSLTSFFNPDGPHYNDMVFQGLCDIFQQASDAGIVVIAAAGNSGTNMRGFFPATCPTVIAVTSINAAGDGPSVISNWLPANSITAEEKASMLAAPGTGIKSTVPTGIVKSGYLPLSGTSMAAPHVAGLAINCFMAGDCTSNMKGAESMAVLQAQAQSRYTMSPPYGFDGDATSTSANKYYGYLAWSKP